MTLILRQPVFLIGTRLDSNLMYRRPLVLGPITTGDTGWPFFLSFCISRSALRRRSAAET